MDFLVARTSVNQAFPNQIIQDFNLNHNEFIEFCVLCGCDYCKSVPKIGNLTAFKLIQKYKTIENIINETNYNFPENYLKDFNNSKKNFLLYYNKIDIQNLKIENSDYNIPKLQEFLIHEIQMNEKRVQNTLKKFNNNYK